MWDRLVHHSNRPDGTEGFLLPYHAYLSSTGDPDEDARRQELLREIAVVPEPGHTRVFSYFSEHTSADVALSTLVRCLTGPAHPQPRHRRGAVGTPRRMAERADRPEMGHRARPGLGAALEALGMRLGMALALELVAGGHVAANADPWPFVDALLRGEVDPPRAYAADVQEVRATWAKLTDERRALLQLLSRFALSPTQARRWFEAARRNAATTETLSDREILDNPYRIAESDLGTLEEPAVSVGMVDRGLLPDPTIAVNCPVPERSRVDSPSDRRRIRGAAGSVLRRAADDGDSLLSAVEVLTRLGRLDLARPCVVPLDWFPGNAEFLDPVIKQIEAEVPTGGEGVTQQLAALQLASHADTELRLGESC